MAKGLSIRPTPPRGVSHKSVQKALATDGSWLARTEDRPLLPTRQWAMSTDLSKPLNSSVLGVPKKRELRAPPSDPLVSSTDARDGEWSGAGEPLGETARLSRATAGSRAAKGGVHARLAKLDSRSGPGSWLDADQARAQVYALGRRAREGVLGCRTDSRRSSRGRLGWRSTG